MPAWNQPAVPAVSELLSSFVLEQGKLRMPPGVFQAWLKHHESLSSQLKAQRAQELIAHAVRLQREAGTAAASGIAQLYLLAADLLKSKAFAPRDH